MELFLAAGQQLVHVSLVADVKQKLVGWRAEHMVEQVMESSNDSQMFGPRWPPLLERTVIRAFANLRSELFQFEGEQFFNCSGE